MKDYDAIVRIILEEAGGPVERPRRLDGVAKRDCSVRAAPLFQGRQCDCRILNADAFPLSKVERRAQSDLGFVSRDGKGLRGMNDVVINKIQSIQRCVRRAREEYQAFADKIREYLDGPSS
jgi:hypothetical protein